MIEALFVALLCGPVPQDTLPELIVTRDDTVVESSARIVIPPGTVIPDRNGDGVLKIVADGIRVVFAPGSVLAGAPQGTPWDRLRGTGIRIDSAKGVRVEGAVVRGYRAGIWGTRVDGLRLVGADVSGNFRQRLHSTPEACDDGQDWLGCHHNDRNEWMTRYGAGIYLEDSSGITVELCRARRGQNGILLDRIEGSKICDNDFSFLSGWGLGLWRSSGNMISRNAFDFCIRGYSHGVYNRGQDSAGILVFEQCSQNQFVENSATHGGDGVFGFAGLEAMGETEGLPDDFDTTRRGNNDNVFIGNDFSWAAAHGLEMTFSFGNQVYGNEFVGNAICGIWAGYSQDMVIAENRFEANGDAGYGLERGGVNIEHSRNNRIESNDFLKNRCGVHLWWDPDEGLAAKPWAKANGVDCAANSILGNRFDGDVVAIHLRSCEGVKLGENRMVDVQLELDADGETTVEEVTPGELAHTPRLSPPPGNLHPVGARPELKGRENIVMGEWGPWDHVAPLIRRVNRSSSDHHYELIHFPEDVTVTFLGAGLELEHVGGAQRPRVSISAAQTGFFPYTLQAGDQQVAGVLEKLSWKVSFFFWQTDPREDLEAWRAEAAGAVAVELPRLYLPYGNAGPSQLSLSEAIDGAQLPRDWFGTFAEANVPLQAGRWRVRTQSDDGIRVRVDDEVVIENWTWHPPTEDTGEFVLSEPRTVRIFVEHFEIDGYSLLQLELERVD